METKEQLNVSMDAKGIVIDGVEYLSQLDAAKAVGLTVNTFKVRVDKFGIERVKIQGSKRCFYRKNDLIAASQNGWFKKWYM